MLSEIDIEKRLSNNSLKITPFERGCLTGVGYDLRLGDYGYSLQSKRKYSIKSESGLWIEPHETVVVTTVEQLKIPSDLAGTVHSQVKKMQLGLQAISTTADPDWEGLPLIHITNNLNQRVYISHGDTICTICFHELQTPSLITCIEPKNKIVDLNTLENIAINQDRLQQQSVQKKFLKKKILLIILLVLDVITVTIFKFLFNFSTGDLTLIVTVMSLIGLFIIEFIKKN